MGYKLWTNEEVEYLIEKWGHDETLKICKKLDRTYPAVRNKAKKLKLGPARQANEFICASELASTINVDRKTIDSYIKKGLKVKKRRFGASKRSNICIKLKDFWEFAKKNQDLIQFYKFQNGDLADEPTWAQEKRFEQLRKRASMKNYNKEWTDNEDRKLQNMFIKGISDEEIAAELKRTVISVVCRRSILSLNIKPAWTDEEITILKENVKNGLTDKEIGKILGKSTRSVQGKRLSLNIKKVKVGFNRYEQSNITR